MSLARRKRKAVSDMDDFVVRQRELELGRDQGQFGTAKTLGQLEPEDGVREGATGVHSLIGADVGLGSTDKEATKDAPSASVPAPVRMSRRVVFVLIDGLGDVSVSTLGFETPLQRAHVPYLDLLASMHRHPSLWNASLIDPRCCVQELA